MHRDLESVRLPEEMHAQIQAEQKRTAALFRTLGRWLKRGLAGAALFILVFYVAESLSIRFRIPRSRDPFGTVPITRFYAVHLKGGRIEYNGADSETQNCVRSVFPHLGYSPCWYARRNSQKQVDL